MKGLNESIAKTGWVWWKLQTHKRVVGRDGITEIFQFRPMADGRQGTVGRESRHHSQQHHNGAPHFCCSMPTFLWMCWKSDTIVFARIPLASYQFHWVVGVRWSRIFCLTQLYWVGLLGFCDGTTGGYIPVAAAANDWPVSRCRQPAWGQQRTSPGHVKAGRTVSAIQNSVKKKKQRKNSVSFVKDNPVRCLYEMVLRKYRVFFYSTRHWNENRYSLLEISSNYYLCNVSLHIR